MTEPFRKSADQQVEARVVALTRRDLDDASRLIRLLTEASGADSLQEPLPRSGQLATSREIAVAARRSLVERRRRRLHFPEGMFGEPGWEIVLLLYSQKDEMRFTVGRLAETLDLPQNSTGRWLRYLEGAGLVRRRPHHLDNRAVLVEISEEGVKAVEAYFSGIPVTGR